MYVSFMHSIIFAEKLNWGFIIFDKIIGYIFQNDIISYHLGPVDISSIKYVCLVIHVYLYFVCVGLIKKK